MSRLIIFFLSVGFVVLTACSSQPDVQPVQAKTPSVPIKLLLPPRMADSFSNLNHIEVITDLAPEQAMIAGKADFAISDHKWSDDTMGRLVSALGQRPITSIYTAPLPLSQEEQQDFLNGTKTIAQPWYLYTRQPMTEQVKQQANYLLSDTMQNTLTQKQLLVLPEALRHRARVAHGLAPAQYHGGYK